MPPPCGQMTPGGRAVKVHAATSSSSSSSAPLRLSLLVFACLLALPSTAHANANRQSMEANIDFGTFNRENVYTNDAKVHAIQFAQVDASSCEQSSGPCRGVVQYVTEARSGFCRIHTRLFNLQTTLNFYVYDVQNQKYLSAQEVVSKRVAFNEVIMAVSPFSMNGLAQVSHDFDPELFGDVCRQNNYNRDREVSTMYDYLQSDGRDFFRSDAWPFFPKGVSFHLKSSAYTAGQVHIRYDKSDTNMREFAKTAGGIFRLRGNKDKNKRNGFLRKIYGFYDIHDPYVEMPDDYAATFKAGWKGW